MHTGVRSRGAGDGCLSTDGRETEGNEMKAAMDGRSLVGVALVAASFAGACDVGPESGDPPDDVVQVRSALGSPFPNPTDIWNLTDLNNMRNTPNGNFRLRAHIEAMATSNWDGGKGWTPIPLFTGTFNGNGFQIRNLVINRPDDANIGLFANVDEAIIQNLGMTNVSIRGGALVGAVAGAIYDSQVSTSYVDGGTVTSQYTSMQGFYIGLFSGLIWGTDVSRSYVRGTVNGYANYVGGFAGWVSTSSPTGARSVIHECYARAAVSPTFTTDPVMAGGFAAILQSSTAEDIYAQGSVTGRGDVGGLFGALEGENIIFHFAYSRNTVVDWDVTGGWAGTYGTLYGETSHIASLFWDATIDGSASSAPVGQAGYSTTVLRSPTATSQFPYDNGTDADWNSAVWNAGSSSQYNSLRNVVRSTQQNPSCTGACGP
jgi:hypothetical protein